MIHIEDANVTFDFEDTKDGCVDIGGFWYILQRRPDIWKLLPKVIIPSLVDTEVEHALANGAAKTMRRLLFLGQLKALCEDYKDIFDEGEGEDKEIKIGELKYEGKRGNKNGK